MSTPENSMATDFTPDLREIALTVWRRRYLIASIMMGSVALGVAYLMLKPVVYKATATVMLEDLTLNLENFQDVTAGAKLDDTTIQTQVKVIGSPSVARQTIKAMELDTVPEFAPKRKTDNSRNQEVIDNFMRRLDVRPQGATRVIEVSFRSADPVLAAEVANQHVEAYLNAQIEAKKHKILSFSTWFQDQVAHMKTELMKKSRAVQEYRAQEKLVMGEDSDDPVYKQISEISSQLVPIEVKKTDLNARLEAIRAAGDQRDLDAIAEVVKSPLVQNLKSQASVISQKVESYRSEFGSNHPKLIAAQKEQAQVNHAIRQEINNIENSLHGELEALFLQENLLKEKLAALGAQTDNIREKTIHLHELELEETASQKLLDSFLAHNEEIQSQTDFARPDAMMLSPAVPPSKPAGPSRALFLMAILVLSGGLSLAVVFTLEILATGLKDFDDIKKHLALTPLGVLPHVNNPLATIMDPHNSGYRENIKRIYMSALMNSPAKTVLFTSALPGEGRSTLLMSMAYYLISIKRRVVIIDMDFFKPSLGLMAGVKPKAGLTELLSGRAGVKDVISINKEGITVVTAGNAILYSPDFLRSPKFQDLLQNLKDNFDYVFIDGGPILTRSDAVAIAEHTEGVIVIANWLKTSRKDMQSLMDALGQARHKIMGVVLNRVEIKKYKSLSSGSDFIIPRFEAA